MNDERRVAAIPQSAGPEPEEIEDRLALCLSGGGYRAMLFHLGVLWYLRDAGLLERLDRVSSVSGGSITAGVLGLRWASVATAGSATEFERQVVAPIRGLAGETIDARSILGGVFGSGSVGERVARRYRDRLFGDATLQDLPDRPRFVINATNVQTGSLFRFSKPYLGDWRIGRCPDPSVYLADAVAASSAFPPVLSPMRLRLPAEAFSQDLGPCGEAPYTTDLYLTDGGVYDNMGIETAWKRCRQVLVSDAGGKLQPEPKPHTNWAQHALRVNGLIDNQVRSLRKRQIVASFRAGERRGAYWGMWTDPAEYPASSRLELPADRAEQLARTATRLQAMRDDLQERLVNFGYGLAERAVRSYFDPAAPAADRFPYERGI